MEIKTQIVDLSNIKYAIAMEGDRVAEQRQFVRDKASRYIRCSDCQYLHENGNCLKVGGFYSSIDNKHCPMEAGGEDE